MRVEVFCKKLQNNEGSEIKLSVRGKFAVSSVIRVFNRLDDLYSNTSPFSPSST